ncbi:MAG: MerR family transcriptional regulator [candidate division KSB1 bacterium]|nr:MerR family transcriptional regulator [candidate division KSB1 bacterium]MDZ7301800.1 MerR family transcriptional regulator [candidate division KSB1 bacterium]MDZ7311421.1 MerR family transcriptional regulator [candidate division KSB1 bacterium]
MTRMPEKTWLKIGQVAKRLNIAVETIRMYEREGILITEKTPTGQRVFNGSDLHWIGCIRRLIKEQGLNLEGIRRLLALMPCWEWRHCTQAERENCPAFHGAMRPCWIMKPEIPATCRADNCRTCVVYQNACQCDNLKEMIYRLRQQPEPAVS